jgi:hypothetical protein
MNCEMKKVFTCKENNINLESIESINININTKAK